MDARAGPPPTELLATKVYHAVTGRSLSDADVSVAGKVVHLAMGAGLGAAYALLARRWPAATSGRGVFYGLGIWAVIEETSLAVLHLKPAPWHVRPGQHALVASAHVDFGVSLDLALRQLLEQRENTAQ